jgi:hypothetical protein
MYAGSLLSPIASVICMRNGIRQGVILSPYLFSVYMRDASKAVINSSMGCHIGSMPCNIRL